MRFNFFPREKQMYRSRITLSATACFAIVLLISSVSPAQKQTESQRERKPKEQAAAVENATPAAKNEDPTFKGMKYRPIGPFRGGRPLTAAGIPGDPTTYYFGSTGGGVWKSSDGAMTLSSVFDKEGTSAVGSLAVAASNHNVLYVGTGEACIRGNISHVEGV